MATMRLIPSTYYVTSSYLSVSNPSNMYNNTDNTSTYCTVRNTQSSTSSYYIYIRGFNFDDIPDEATVNSFTVKFRARESGITTSTSYRPYLANNTTTITSSCSMPSTSSQVLTFTNVSATWDTIKGYGNNFGIRINCRRASRNTTGYMYIYGAEIEVDYTLPVQYDVTINNSTSATVTTSDTAPFEGDNVTIFTNTVTGITIKDNGTDITNSFERETGETITAVPSEDFDTGFSDSGVNFYQSSSTTGTDWLEYAIGHSAESPYSTSNTSNTYAKPEGDTAWINYHFDFSSIPTGATITDVEVRVYGARENASIDTSHVARFQCYSGSTAKGSIQNFTSTSNSLVTVTNPGTWTATELHDAVLRFEVGYYGGRMLGISWEVTYEVDGYVYTISNISADHTITVTSSGSSGPVIKMKVNGNWVTATKVYKKVNGSWVQQSDLTKVFDSGTNYIKGN